MSSETGSPWMLPPDDLIQAEADLDRLTDSLETSVEAILSRWEGRVQADVRGAFSEMLSQVDAAHRRLTTSLENELAAAGDQQRGWQAVATYLDETQEACIQPLQVFLGESNPLDVLYSICQDARFELLGATESLPVRAVLPRSPELFSVGSDVRLPERLTRFSARQRDSWRATRRSVGNAFRRMAGRQTAGLDHPTRVCPPRELAGGLMLKRVEDNIASSAGMVSKWLREELIALERSVWNWTTAGLQHLGELDSPSFQTPDFIRLRWPEEALATQESVEPSAAFCGALSFAIRQTPDVERPDCLAAMRELREELAVSGTPLSRKPPRIRTSRRVGTIDNFPFDRTRLANALLSLGRAVRDLETNLLSEIARGAFSPIETTYDAVSLALKGVERQAMDLLRSAPPADLPKKLSDLLIDSSSLERLYADLAGLSKADRALTNPGEEAWKQLTVLIESLPSSLQLRSVVGSNPRSFRADLRKMTRTAFERPLSPRLKIAAEPLRRDLARVWSDTEHVMDVVRTTFGTTIQQLSTEAEGSSPPSPAELADLFETGLRRARVSLEERYQSLGSGWAEFMLLLDEIVNEDWDRVLRAVQSEDFLADQLLGIHTVVSRGAERGWKRLVEGWGTAINTARASGRLLRIRGRDLIKLGKTAVGASAASAAERHQALDTVASARAVYSSLPLVYRQLFSAEPVSDAGLAENRGDELRDTVDLINRWRRGVGVGAVVVHGPLGSGRTTFLSLLAEKLGSELRTVLVTLDRRPASEEEIAGVLALALYPETPFGGSLDDLDQLVHERDQPRSRLVLIDNLELLLLQAAGGTDLLHKILLFCIRTDDRIAWVGAIGTLAWQFAKRAAPAATRLPTALALHPWDASSLEDMILVRHRRSGIPLKFEVPENPSALVGQRVRRAKTKEAVQRIMSGEFFERLFRVAGQNPTRALFEWIRAGEFGQDSDILCVTELQSLSFDYLQGFEDNTAFTLRSLLVHNLLTIEEHDTLFRSGIDGAIMAFETLLSEGLIERADLREGEAIVPGCRYRIRRLVLEPVHRSLKERHFIY